jgi:1-acyl-sn-glycerol-3-phosphate acyltransferase
MCRCTSSPSAACRHRLLGRLLQRLGTEFVARDDVRQSVDDAERLLARVHQGDGVVFFPEATFTAAPGLRPFRLGAFKVAAASGAPVVPIAVRGSRAILRGESRRPRPGRMWPYGSARRLLATTPAGPVWSLCAIAPAPIFSPTAASPILPIR